VVFWALTPFSLPGSFLLLLLGLQADFSNGFPRHPSFAVGVILVVGMVVSMYWRYAKKGGGPSYLLTASRLVVTRPVALGPRRLEACEVQLRALPRAVARRFAFGTGTVLFGPDPSHSSLGWQWFVPVEPVAIVGVPNPQAVADLINAARGES
jgi:hypothetical protein